jgi:excisionase family DNA binding protein
MSEDMHTVEVIQTKSSITDISSRIPSEMTPLWTVDEVAAYLRVKAETVRAMARRGELHALKIGREWRFPQSALMQLTQNQQEVG